MQLRTTVGNPSAVLIHLTPFMHRTTNTDAIILCKAGFVENEKKHALYGGMRNAYTNLVGESKRAILFGLPRRRCETIIKMHTNNSVGRHVLFQLVERYVRRSVGLV